MVLKFLNFDFCEAQFLNSWVLKWWRVLYIGSRLFAGRVQSKLDNTPVSGTRAEDMCMTARHWLQFADLST